VKPSKHPTRELSLDEIQAEVKRTAKHRQRRPWYYGLATVLTTAGLGTGGVAWSRGESQETTNAKTELRQGATEKTVDALTQRVDAGERETNTRLGKVERKVDSMRAEQRIVNQLVLEKLGVPRSRQPAPKDDDE